MSKAPQGTNAPATTPNMPSPSAETSHDSKPSLDKLPKHGPRLPVRSVHKQQPPRQSATMTVQSAGTASTPRLKRSNDIGTGQTATQPNARCRAAEPPAAKKTKLEEGPSQPSASMEPINSTLPLSPLPSVQPNGFSQPLHTALALPQAQHNIQPEAFGSPSQQHILGLFSSTAGLTLAAKQDALDKLVNLIAGGT